MKKILWLWCCTICLVAYSHADLTSYEKLLVNNITTILSQKHTESIDTINLDDFWINYLQRVDQDKRQELLTAIQQQWDEKKPKIIDKENNYVQDTTKIDQKSQIWESVMKDSWYPRSKAYSIEASWKTIDYEKVQQTRMQWVNQLRLSRGLPTLKYSSSLEYSADQWNKIMIWRDQWSHQRTIGDSFYNYKKIELWFKNLWLEFVNIKRTTFVENVWVRRGWKCKEEECSDEVIKELREIFEYYMAEEGTQRDAHFKSMVNPNFKIGWLAFDISSSKKLYFTVHYATEIKEKP